MIKLKFLLLFLISFNIFAGTMPNNDYKLGKASDTVDKGFEFDTGDGVNNPMLKADDSKKLKYSANDFQMGDGATGNDKCFTLDPTAGSKVCWDGTAQKLVFNNGNGGNDKKFGTGTGGGGGENFNNAFGVDDNANAEDGLTLWTASAGTFAITSTDPLESEQSFTWIPAAQNDTLTGPVLDFDKDIMKGRSCLAEIEYIGGDENISLKVLNDDDEELAVLVLNTHTISAPENVGFICPSDADIIADADKGNLRIVIDNTGASASPIIKWDKSYIGTNKGLSESTNPDSYSARVNGTTAANVSVNIPDWISCSKDGTGDYGCTLDSSFTVAPSCTCTTELGGFNQETCSAQSLTATSWKFRVTNNSQAATDAFFGVQCEKQGADVKQSVQVYKSIPKVSQNVSEFSALISAAGVVSNENVDWINGNCSVMATSNFDCFYISGLLDGFMNCSATPVENTGNINAYIKQNSSAGFVSYTTLSNADTPSARQHFVHCQKAGVDYKMPTVQPIIVGQVTSSYAESASKNIREEACTITNSGTPTASNDLCNSWIDSIADGGVGTPSITVTAGIFSKKPVCTASVNATTAHTATAEVNSPTSIIILTRTNAGAAADVNVHIKCTGER